MSEAPLTAPSIQNASETFETETIADLLERLGNVPPSRVRMHPTPGTATEADVIAIKTKENCLYELVDGTLVEKGLGIQNRDSPFCWPTTPRTI